MPVYSGLDFGACGDEVTNDAAAIQKTIDACTASGGGTVLYNAGRVILRDCEVAWGQRRAESFRHALESHGVGDLEIDNFRGETAGPQRYAARLID